MHTLVELLDLVEKKKIRGKKRKGTRKGVDRKT